jgi:Protein of unknown function (DUF3014)
MINKPMIGVAAGVVVIAAGAWYFLHSRHVAPLPAVPAPIAAPAEPAEGAIEHPVPTPSGSVATTALPALADSDAPLRDALGDLPNGNALSSFLRPEGIIRSIVVTVDNLPRQKVAVDKRPIPPVAGNFAASGDELHATLDAQNFERYKPMVAVIDQMDMTKAAAVYFHFYPLFQQSYQNLGYPNGYFNDRLVQVIDSLLATPQLSGPIELERPNVMYTFADPALEARPAGQKLLIRMGPQNASTIKTKLMAFRAIITATPPKN